MSLSGHPLSMHLVSSMQLDEPELVVMCIMCVSAVKYYNSVTHLCMVRCGTEEYRQVTALHPHQMAPLCCCDHHQLGTLHATHRNGHLHV